MTEKGMHEHYLQRVTSPKVSYPFYCRVMKSMKVSVVKLGHEECELCTSSSKHLVETGHSASVDEISDNPTSCTVCNRYTEHLRLASMSRNAYRSDGEAVKPGCVVLAVDLQKVVLEASVLKLQIFNTINDILGHTTTKTRRFQKHRIFSTSTGIQRNIRSGGKVHEDASYLDVSMGRIDCRSSRKRYSQLLPPCDSAFRRYGRYSG